MFAVLVVLAVTSLLFFTKFLWDRRKLYAFSSKVSGPIGFPIIGNSLIFNCEVVDFYENLIRVLRSYQHPMRIWMGPKLVAVFTDLSHVEKIVTSTRITYKGELYKFLTIFVGDGLITNSGQSWKEHRRAIQPMLNLKYVFSRIDTMQKHCDRLLVKLEKFVDDGIVNLWPIFNCCFYDILSEIVCGNSTDMQCGKNEKVLKCFEDMYDNMVVQMIKPWLHVPFIFNLTRHKKERNEILDGIRFFLKQALDESRARLADVNKEETENLPIIDQINLERLKNPSLMDDKVLLDHIFTLLAAGEDPASLITCATCLCFGMYPEHQRKAVEEIRDVLGKTQREITEIDLPKLEFLEMCISDVLRLFPIAPFVMRTCTEEFSLQDFTIPVGCEVMIPIDMLHRDPNQWENPDHFYPDHFLPEAVAKRHPFTYIPFSGGPRKCIGIHLAMTSIKLIMAKVLQKFSFEAEGKYPDLKFKADISLRVIGGYKVKISRRKWN